MNKKRKPFIIILIIISLAAMSCSDLSRIAADAKNAFAVYHILTFYANDGSGNTATQAIAEDSTVALLANTFINATDNSLIFAGWSATTDGSVEYADCANYTMGTSDAELYAVWEESHGISISTDIEDESNVTVTPDDSVEITKGTSASFSIPNTYSSYQWYLDGDVISGATSSSISVETSSMSLGVHSLAVLFSDSEGIEYSETITIYVVWTGATYNITYNGNGSIGGSVPTDNTEYITGDTATVLGNTGNLVRTNYVFTGWNAESDLSGIDYGAGAEVTFSGSDITLYAKWIPTSSIVFKEDFSTSGYLNGSTPDVGGNWQATGTLQVVDGVLDTNTAGSSTTKTAYAAFTEALGAGETLTLTFETTTTAGTFTNFGYAGFSLFTGFSSSSSPGTERVFMGSVASYGLWGIDQTIPGTKTLISPDLNTQVQTAYFTYDYDTGGWSFTVGGRELSSGTGTASLALNAVRIGAGAIDSEYADIAITNIYIDKQ